MQRETGRGLRSATWIWAPLERFVELEGLLSVGVYANFFAHHFT